MVADAYNRNYDYNIVLKHNNGTAVLTHSLSVNVKGCFPYTFGYSPVLTPEKYAFSIGTYSTIQLPEDFDWYFQTSGGQNDTRPCLVSSRSDYTFDMNKTSAGATSVF